MQVWKSLFTAGLALPILFGSATAQEPSSGPLATSPAAEQCFGHADIRGFREPRRGVLLIEVGDGEVWEMLVGPCPKYDFASARGAMGPDTFMIESAGSRICVGKRANLRVPVGDRGSNVDPRITPNPKFLQSCRVSRIRKLSAEEVAALAK